MYSNIPLQIEGGNVDANLSLETRLWKRPGGSALVNILANWSTDVIGQRQRVPYKKR